MMSMPGATRRTPGPGIGLAAGAVVLAVAWAGVTPAAEGQASAPRTLVSQAPGLRQPAPADGTSVVIVQTGGDRTGTKSVAPLAGVRLGLFDSADAAAPVGETWAQCTSDTSGKCKFVVPGTYQGGPNDGRRLVIKQLGVPGGWYENPSLRTGPGNGSDSEETPYEFRTPPLRAGTAYSSVKDFMIDDSQVAEASSGIWQQSRVNPPLPKRCGLDVALVLDLSASVRRHLPDLKKAADTFIHALEGTRSRMALFTFDRGSPSDGTRNYPELTPVSTTTEASAFKRRYASWKAGSGTNWDRALWAAAQARPKYEAAVVLTDGNPTYYDIVAPRGGDGTNTRMSEVENGIYSANALKAKGTRTLAVGVGKGVTGLTRLNLRAISGPVAFDGGNTATADYYQTTDFPAAGKALRDLVLSNCKETISVVKQIVPAANKGENIDGSVPAGAGWRFNAASTTTGTGGLPATKTTAADGTGAVNFELKVPGSAAEVKVAETQQAGHTLITQDGKNASCRNLTDDSPVKVRNAAATGFTVSVARDTAVSCTIYNKPTRPKPRLTLVKKVDNRYGGTAKPTAWTLAARGPSSISGRTSQRTITRAPVKPGKYQLVESGGPRNYRSMGWKCADGGKTVPVHHRRITLSTGDKVRCTITNKYVRKDEKGVL